MTRVGQVSAQHRAPSVAAFRGSYWVRGVTGQPGPPAECPQALGLAGGEVLGCRNRPVGSTLRRDATAASLSRSPPAPRNKPLVAQSTPLTPGKGHPGWHEAWRAGRREPAPTEQPNPPGIYARSRLPASCPRHQPGFGKGGEAQHPKTHPWGYFPGLGGGDACCRQGCSPLPGTAAACLIALKAQQMAEWLQDVLLQHFGAAGAPSLAFLQKQLQGRRLGRALRAVGEEGDDNDPSHSGQAQGHAAAGELKGIKTFAGLTLHRFLPAVIPGRAALPASTSITCLLVPGDKSPFCHSLPTVGPCARGSWWQQPGAGGGWGGHLRPQLGILCRGGC